MYQNKNSQSTNQEIPNRFFIVDRESKLTFPSKSWGLFPKLREESITFVVSVSMSVHQSVRLYGKIRLPVNGFS